MSAPLSAVGEAPEVWELWPDAEVLAVHAALLPSGKVLYFGGDQHDEQPDLPLDATRLWNPRTGQVERIPSPAGDVFCCGHCMLPNGDVLVVGGTALFETDPKTEEYFKEHADAHHFIGLPDTHIFHWRTNTWSVEDPMANGRWYPTVITLPDGRALALSGHTGGTEHHENTEVEVFDPAKRAWSRPFPTSPELTETGEADYGFGVHPHPMVYYPRLHVTRAGVFSSTALQTGGTDGPRRTRLINPNTGSLTDLGPPPFKTTSRMYSFELDPLDIRFIDPEGVRFMDQVYARSAFTSVLLPLRPPDYRERILIAGEKRPRLYDLSQPYSPNNPFAGGWQSHGEHDYDMRAYVSGVLLPDGRVLLINGSRTEHGPFGVLGAEKGGHDEDAIFWPELYNPEDGSWETLTPTPARIARIYHSVALLLPDGRVWVAGSNHDSQRNRGGVRKDDVSKGDARELTMEALSPPYLFTQNATGERVLAHRPILYWSPSGARYGITVPLLVDNADEIQRVTLVRCSTITHAFNPDQRLVDLEIVERDAIRGRLEIKMPPNAQIAPPGYYMLFGLNPNGTPSEARFIRLTDKYPTFEVYIGTGELWYGRPPTFGYRTRNPAETHTLFDFGTVYFRGLRLARMPTQRLIITVVNTADLGADDVTVKDVYLRLGSDFHTEDVRRDPQLEALARMAWYIQRGMIPPNLDELERMMFSEPTVVPANATLSGWVPRTINTLSNSWDWIMTFEPHPPTSASEEYRGTLVIETTSEDYPQLEVNLHARVVALSEDLDAPPDQQLF